MRDCKEWMDSLRGSLKRPKTASVQMLKDIIKREIHDAPNTVVLNRRYSIMATNLITMHQREELTGRAYLCLKDFLRGEYEKRWEVLK